jgi:NAD(P)H-dependent FMN reductase
MPTPPRRFLFLVSSGRPDGNSEQLARHAAQSLSAADTQEWIRLADVDLPAFADLRHASAAAWAPAIEGEPRRLLEATLAATDIVFVAPVYWYSLPASAKLYLDHWTTWMRAPGWDFKPRMAGKTLWGICVASDESEAIATPLRETLRLSADYMQMHWGGFLFGSGNRPGDIRRDEKSLAEAGRFFPGTP